MEDGIENCHEWSLQAANQVLLLFEPIENPRCVKTNWSYFILEHDEVCFIIYYTQPLDIISILLPIDLLE
jgi:hypothetical protein